MTYIITRKNTYEVDNKVYFAEDRSDALEMRNQFAEDGHNWVIAQLENDDDVAGNRQ